jgi:hypothetical protein
VWRFRAWPILGGAGYLQTEKSFPPVLRLVLIANDGMNGMKWQDLAGISEFSQGSRVIHQVCSQGQKKKYSLLSVDCEITNYYYSRISLE